MQRTVQQSTQFRIGSQQSSNRCMLTGKWCDPDLVQRAHEHSRRSFRIMRKNRLCALHQHLCNEVLHEESKQLTDALAKLCYNSCSIRGIGRRRWAGSRLERIGKTSQVLLNIFEDGSTPSHSTCLLPHAHVSNMAPSENVKSERADANLQQVPPLHCGEDFIGIEAKLCPGALIVQEQAFDERWNEGACGRLACMTPLKVSTLHQPT